MRKITKKQFLSDVMHEIEMLKEHATDFEKARLDFNTLDPVDVNFCIYGQLALSCISARAKELMDKSCIRQWILPTASTNIEKSFNEIKQYINGLYDHNSKRWSDEKMSRFAYLSLLEGYIQTNFAKNGEIIAYIKGETETLTL